MNTGDLKYNLIGQMVAIRSAYDEQSSNAWLVGHPANGAYWARNEEIVDNPDWVDVPLPGAESQGETNE